MITRPRLFLLVVLLLLYSPSSKGQDRKNDIVRVRTRVVFIDTLVQDKQTGAPVADLTRENFQVMADGKSRTLSYFSRAGEGRRRPLALVLVVDLWARDANEDLRRAEVLESLGAALKKLAPEDEVAVMAELKLLPISPTTGRRLQRRWRPCGAFRCRSQRGITRS
ncbi:MAG: hypothetical protein DMF74_02375 [Acidobacteria bacterium]|nr:MAG: hypothetical protein DMF74_02375 [Acidobacteriota bacterium]